MPTNYVTPVGTQSVYSVISRDDFREGMYEAIDESTRRGRISPFQRFIHLRRMRNSRRFERAYEFAMEAMPVTVYGEGFNFEEFLDWLIENLPAILEILMSLAVFL